MEQSGTLEQAIEFVRAGNRPHAARILAQYVTQNPSDETGWLWLAASLEKPDQQSYCLQKAKALDSSNPGTPEELEFYLGLSGPVYTYESPINLPPHVEEPAPPPPVVEPPPPPPAEAVPAPQPPERPTNPTPKPVPVGKGLSRTQTIILIVLLIILIAIIAVLAYMLLGGGSLPFFQTGQMPSGWAWVLPALS